MDIFTQQHPDHFLLTIGGRFTFKDNEIFRKALQEAERCDSTRIVVDLAALDYIDSSALGMLLLLRDIGEKKSATIELHHAQGQPLKIFDISKFGSLFALHP